MITIMTVINLQKHLQSLVKEALTGPIRYLGFISTLKYQQ